MVEGYIFIFLVAIFLLVLAFKKETKLDSSRRNNEQHEEEIFYNKYEIHQKKIDEINQKKPCKINHLKVAQELTIGGELIHRNLGRCKILEITEDETKKVKVLFDDTNDAKTFVYGSGFFGEKILYKMDKKNTAETGRRNLNVKGNYRSSGRIYSKEEYEFLERKREYDISFGDVVIDDEVREERYNSIDNSYCNDEDRTMDYGIYESDDY
ncbi:hypothetical protein RJG79_10585 [Mycoplasmatota bacterium WC44]